MHAGVVRVEGDDVVDAHVVAKLLQRNGAVERFAARALVLPALIQHRHNNGDAPRLAAYRGNGALEVRVVLVRAHGDVVAVHGIGQAVVEHIGDDENVVAAHGFGKRPLPLARAEAREPGVDDVGVALVARKGDAVFVLALLLGAPAHNVTVNLFGELLAAGQSHDAERAVRDVGKILGIIRHTFPPCSKNSSGRFPIPFYSILHILQGKNAGKRDFCKSLVKSAVNRHDAEISFVYFAKIRGNTADKLRVGRFEADGHHDVEDKVRVRGPAHNAKVVEAERRIDVLENLAAQRAQSVDVRVVGHNGVHVDGNENPEFFAQIALNEVHGVVALHNVDVGGDLGVGGRENAPGAVVVDNEVVHTQNAVVRANLAFERRHKFRLRGLAQKQVDRVLKRADAGAENEQRNHHAEPAVHRDVRIARQHKRQQRDGGRRRVGKAVGHDGAGGGRAGLFAEPVVEPREPKLGGDGHEQNGERRGAVCNRGGLADARGGRFQKLKAHQKNQKGNGQRRNIFAAPVAVGVVLVGGLFGDAEADKRDQGRGGVGQVVDRVRRNRNAAAGRTRKQLAGGEQRVDKDADRAANLPVRRVQRAGAFVGARNSLCEAVNHRCAAPDCARITSEKQFRPLVNSSSIRLATCSGVLPSCGFSSQ